MIIIQTKLEDNSEWINLTYKEDWTFTTGINLFPQIQFTLTPNSENPTMELDQDIRMVETDVETTSTVNFYFHAPSGDTKDTAFIDIKDFQDATLSDFSIDTIRIITFSQTQYLLISTKQLADNVYNELLAGGASIIYSTINNFGTRVNMTLDISEATLGVQNSIAIPITNDIGLQNQSYGFDSLSTLTITAVKGVKKEFIGSIKKISNNTVDGYNYRRINASNINAFKYTIPQTIFSNKVWDFFSQVVLQRDNLFLSVKNRTLINDSEVNSNDTYETALSSALTSVVSEFNYIWYIKGNIIYLDAYSNIGNENDETIPYNLLNKLPSFSLEQDRTSYQNSLRDICLNSQFYPTTRGLVQGNDGLNLGGYKDIDINNIPFRSGYLSTPSDIENTANAFLYDNIPTSPIAYRELVTARNSTYASVENETSLGRVHELMYLRGLPGENTRNLGDPNSSVIRNATYNIRNINISTHTENTNGSIFLEIDYITSFTDKPSSSYPNSEPLQSFINRYGYSEQYKDKCFTIVDPQKDNDNIAVKRKTNNINDFSTLLTYGQTLIKELKKDNISGTFQLNSVSNRDNTNKFGLDIGDFLNLQGETSQDSITIVSGLTKTGMTDSEYQASVSHINYLFAGSSRISYNNTSSILEQGSNENATLVREETQDLQIVPLTMGELAIEDNLVFTNNDGTNLNNQAVSKVSNNFYDDTILKAFVELQSKSLNGFATVLYGDYGISLGKAPAPNENISQQQLKVQWRVLEQNNYSNTSQWNFDNYINNLGYYFSGEAHITTNDDSLDNAGSLNITYPINKNNYYRHHDAGSPENFTLPDDFLQQYPTISEAISGTLRRPLATNGGITVYNTAHTYSYFPATPLTIPSNVTSFEIKDTVFIFDYDYWQIPFVNTIETNIFKNVCPVGFTFGTSSNTRTANDTALGNPIFLNTTAYMKPKDVWLDCKNEVIHYRIAMEEEFITKISNGNETKGSFDDIKDGTFIGKTIKEFGLYFINTNTQDLFLATKNSDQLNFTIYEDEEASFLVSIPYGKSRPKKT